MKNLIIAITGPTGSGKSTVANALAAMLEPCANIDTDHIKHMTKGAFSFELGKDGTKIWSYNGWRLVGDTIGVLAKNYQQNNHNVIINGYLPEEAWESIGKHLALTQAILLQPDMEVSITRDQQRKDDFAMGHDVIAEHYDYFSNTDFYKTFTTIDSSQDTPEQTVQKILDLIMN